MKKWGLPDLRTFIHPTCLGNSLTCGSVHVCVRVHVYVFVCVRLSRVTGRTGTVGNGRVGRHVGVVGRGRSVLYQECEPKFLQMSFEYQFTVESEKYMC